VRRISDEEVAAREKAYALRLAAVSGGGVPPDDSGPFIRLRQPAAAQRRETHTPPATADVRHA
jgi:hypothetical protein